MTDEPDVTDEATGEASVMREPRFERRRAALSGGAAVLGLGVLVVVVANLVGGESAGPTAVDPSSSAAASARSTDDGIAAPTPSSRPTPSPVPAQSGAPSGSSWRMTARFDSSPGSSYVTDVIAWNGGFVAIGSAWESEYRVNDEKPAMWTSPDGESWEQVRIELGVDDVTLIGLEVRADGRLLLVGTVPGYLDRAPEDGPLRSRAWISDDGAAWEKIALPLTEGMIVDSLTYGPRGYALGMSTPYVEFAPGADHALGELWHSTSGIDWTRTFEGASGVVAGDEGFVAIATPLAAGPSSVVASGDGKTWHSSGLITAPLLSAVAPLGGDWLVTGITGNPATIIVFRSANGLDWMPVLDVNDLTGPEGPKTGQGLTELAITDTHLTGGAGSTFLMLGSNHCCAQVGWSYGVWETVDGTTWTQALAGDSFVSSVATNGTTIVLGGHLGRGLEAAFWIHER